RREASDRRDEGLLPDTRLERSIDGQNPRGLTSDVPQPQDAAVSLHPRNEGSSGALRAVNARDGVIQELGDTVRSDYSRGWRARRDQLGKGSEISKLQARDDCLASQASRD